MPSGPHDQGDRKKIKVNATQKPYWDRTNQVKAEKRAWNGVEPRYPMIRPEDKHWGAYEADPTFDKRDGNGKAKEGDLPKNVKEPAKKGWSSLQTAAEIDNFVEF
jgi:hypothetical protein